MRVRYGVNGRDRALRNTTKPIRARTWEISGVRDRRFGHLAGRYFTWPTSGDREQYAEQSDAIVSGTAASGEQESGNVQRREFDFRKRQASGSPSRISTTTTKSADLPALSMLEYERERKDAAERLNLRATILDRLVGSRTRKI